MPVQIGIIFSRQHRRSLQVMQSCQDAIDSCRIRPIVHLPNAAQRIHDQQTIPNEFQSSGIPGNRPGLGLTNNSSCLSACQWPARWSQSGGPRLAFRLWSVPLLQWACVTLQVRLLHEFSPATIPIAIPSCCFPSFSIAMNEDVFPLESMTRSGMPPSTFVQWVGGETNALPGPPPFTITPKHCSSKRAPAGLLADSTFRSAHAMDRIAAGLEIGIRLQSKERTASQRMDPMQS